MPKFRELEWSKREEREEFLKEVEEREPKVKPRLTFPFSLSKEREMAIEQIEAEKPNPEAVLAMLNSDDFVVYEAGLKIVPECQFSENQKILLASALRKIIVDRRSYLEVKSSAIDYLRYAGQVGAEELSLLIRGELKGVSVLRVTAENTLKSCRSHLANTEFRQRKKGKELSLTGRLLSSRKPLFALGYQKGLLEKIREMEDLLSKMLEDDAGFIGVTINGSVSKGYAIPESDLDVAFVGTAGCNLYEKYLFMKEKGLDVCETVDFIQTRPDLSVALTYSNPDSSSRIFHGLFLGDNDLLIETQRRVVLCGGPDEYDEIRRSILETETDIEKSILRAHIGDNELRSIKMIISLTRVPPPYEETVAILDRRLRSTTKRKHSC